MSLIRQIPPSDDVKALVAAIPGVRFNPGVVVAQEGPDRHLGPEAAGAILVLHMTLSDEAAADRFWRTTTAVKQTLPTAAGFIRLFSFFDGPSGYLVAFWRTAEDARAFAAAPAHRDAMSALDRERFEYSHFVGLWTAQSTHRRNLYCPRCEAVTAAPATHCQGCGEALDDAFVSSQPDAAPAPA